MTLCAKQLLRQQIRQNLKQMTNDDRIRQSSFVTKTVLNHPKYLAAQSISIYLSLNTEISTREIIQHAFQFQKHVFVPRYNSSAMDMVRIYSMNDLDSLPMTKWNIRQPALDDNTREIATNQIDLVIVPGLAFSLQGARLGHGKGYYDKYLSSLSENSYTIGLGFKQQIVEHNQIPMSPTDIYINEILIDNE